LRRAVSTTTTTTTTTLFNWGICEKSNIRSCHCTTNSKSNSRFHQLPIRNSQPDLPSRPHPSFSSLKAPPVPESGRERARHPSPWRRPSFFSTSRARPSLPATTVETYPWRLSSSSPSS
jgi:hypothetical protein